MAQPNYELLTDYSYAIEQERRLCRTYRNFFRAAWEQIEPETSLQENWHYDYLCDELQRQAERIDAGEPKEYDLIINIPPRSAKSTLISKLLLPWVWSWSPKQKFLTASYDAALSLEHAVVARGLILSDWYKELWPGHINLVWDQNVKCLAAGTEILMSDGSVKKVEQISSGDCVQSSDGVSVTTDNVVTVRSSGIQKTIRISLSDGSIIDVTAPHRLAGWNNWVHARNLEVGDPICVIGKSRSQLSTLSTDDAFLMAVWLAEGTKSNSTGFYISTLSVSIRSRLREICKKRGWTYTQTTDTLCTLSMKKRRNDVTPQAFLRKYGLRHLTTTDIRVPKEIFTSGDSAVSEFVATYISCDGCVIASKNYKVEITSCSEAMIRDLQLLLKRFGIQSKVRNGEGKYRKDGVYIHTKRFWRLDIGNKESVLKMAHMKVYDKESKWNILMDHKRGLDENSGSIPPAWRSHLSHARSWFKSRGCDLDIGTKGWATKRKVLDIARIEGNHFLVSKLNGGLEWREIVSITEGPEVETFDVQTKNHNCFFANGILSHNSYYANDKGGYRISTSVGGSGTGRGGDWIIVDDPLSAEEADSEQFRLRALRWWTNTMHKRLNDQKVGIRVIVMQRLHEGDLTGEMLKRGKKNYRLICLPAEDSDDVSPVELRKFYVNGLLFPERLSHATLEEDKIGLGEYGYAGQMQQRPSPPEGGIFKRQNWKYWRPIGSDLPNVTVKVNGRLYTMETQDLPAAFDDFVLSADMAFKDLKDSDYVAMGAWGVAGPNKYIVDRVKAKMNFAASLRATRAFKLKHPTANAILVEDKANGPAIIGELRREIPGVIAIQPQGSKFARAMPMSRQQEAGNIFLPHPSLAPWADPLTGDFVNEYAGFPTGSHDDDVDQGSQAINHLSGAVKVVKGYNGGRVAYKINFRNISPTSTLIASQWVETNMHTSVVLALWQADTMKLWVFDCFETSSPQPEIVIPSLNYLIRRDSEQFVQDVKPFLYYGNALMFARKDGTMQPSTKDGMIESYSRFEISLLDNLLYDEPGAILLLSRIIGFKGLKVHERCEELGRQLSAWSIDGRAPAAGFGYCRALCNMVSALSEEGAMDQHSEKLGSYSPRKERIRQQMDLADNLGQLGEYLRNQTIDVPEAPPGPDAWAGIY